MKAGESCVEVRVRLKPGVVDAEAMATQRALGLLGIGELEGVRISRTYELEFRGVSEKEALRRASESVEKLLANPVIHSVTMNLKAGGPGTLSREPSPGHRRK